MVIGGAGYIGEAWSEYMIRRYQAQIVWIGRSQLNAAIQSKIDRLSALGPEPFYIAADAADKHSLQQAYEQVKNVILIFTGLFTLRWFYLSKAWKK